MTTNQFIKSKVIGSKGESLLPPEKFQFVLTGELLTENNSEFFRLENGFQLKVKRVIASSYPSGMTNWKVIPTTDNGGQVVNLILDSPLSKSAQQKVPSSLLIFEGRIVEVAKKGNRIKVKVKRQGSKDLKITLLDAPKEMKIGQLWFILVVMKQGYLYIQKAKYLQD